MNPLLVLQIIDGLLELVADVPALVAQFTAARDQIEKLHAEGRSLTAEDWAAVHGDIDASLAVITKAAEES